MEESELEWFEDNWNRGKCARKAISYRRTWKLFHDRWDDEAPSEYYGDHRCWKSTRKTHYQVKKIHKVKRRKPKEREHWRYKCHLTYSCLRSLGFYKRPTRFYYYVDDAYGALGFMESLKDGDFLKKKDFHEGGYHNDVMYEFAGMGYDDESREGLFVMLRAVEAYSSEWRGNKVKWLDFHMHWQQKVYTYDDRNEYRARKFPNSA